MGKERVSERLAAGHARHWIEICGDVKYFLDWLNKELLHVSCMKCGSRIK